MKKFLNEKGFTLVEILVVVAIIAILFITLIPQIDHAVNRSRQAGVKTDFRSFQGASETYLRTTNGSGLNKEQYDGYLDVGLQTVQDNNGSSPVDTGLDSKENDPWGTPYDVHIYPDFKLIVITSFGPNGKSAAQDGATSDNIVLATYVIEGKTVSCTNGFATNEMVSTVLNESIVPPVVFECGKTFNGDAPGDVNKAIFIP